VRRREVIALLGGAAAWPVAGRAQQSAKRPIIGFLGASTAFAWRDWVAAFVEGMREHGWIEGRTVSIEYRWADGRVERYSEIAAEFARLKVGVIVTVGSAVSAAQQVTSIIPIVFAVATDPIGGGMAASLARPEGNTTGLSVQSPDLVGKRVELLREVLPGIRGLAIMANAAYPAAVLEMNEMEGAARTLGLDISRSEIRRAEDIAPTIETIKGHSDALYACADSLVNANGVRIVTLALAARLPTFHYAREYVASGGLLSYGPDYRDLFRRAAKYVDKILHGTKPSDLLIEQPTKFELVLNLKTAKALGITIPPTLLARTES